MSNPSAPPSLLAELFASAMRHGLTAASTLLVADGFITHDQGTQVVTWGLGLASIGLTAAWSYFQKRNAKKVVVQAAVTGVVPK